MRYYVCLARTKKYNEICDNIFLLERATAIQRGWLKEDGRINDVHTKHPRFVWGFYTLNEALTFYNSLRSEVGVVVSTHA